MCNKEYEEGCDITCVFDQKGTEVKLQANELHKKLNSQAIDTFASIALT